jgi:hypothetical protein
MSDTLYERDFYAWANEQVSLLRAGRLAALLAHLLKWQAQPERNGRSWLLTILEQRRDVSAVLEDNPSLAGQIGDILAKAYQAALLAAQRETDLPQSAFPAESPWTFAQAMHGEPAPDSTP